MRLLSFFIAFILSKFVSAAEIEADELVESTEQPNFVNLDVSYEILEKPKFSFDTPIEFTTEEIATFNLTFLNNEDSNVTVVGLAGSVVDAITGYEVANVTAQELGPFNVAINGSANFQAPIQLNLPEGSFFLAPILFVVKADEVMKVGIRPLSIFISPPPLSFFNPGFLSVQVLLGLIIVGSTYLVVNSKNGKQGSKSKSTKKGAADKKPVDDSWLPSIHKK